MWSGSDSEIAGRYMAYSPSPSNAPQSPHLSARRSAAASAIVEQEKSEGLDVANFDLDMRSEVFLPICVNWSMLTLWYLAELLAERQNIGPFMPVLPQCYRLLNQEILRVTNLLGNTSVIGQSGFEHANLLAFGGLHSSGGADMSRWQSRFQTEMSGLLQPSSPAQNWLSSPSSSSGLIVKRTIRVDIPVDLYPNFNFVGRLLGPRGNSLKRVEATTECRVLIRGRGSIKDPARVISEEMMRGKPGYEHLNEPLHILVEAELPVDVIDARLMQAREILEDLLKPVDESQDFFKKQQLRELAVINGTLRDEGSPMSAGSVSPFHNSLGGMKRAKTRV